MKRFFPFFFLPLPLFGQDKQPDFSKMEVGKLYENLCASCHGAKFEGGLGGSLTDGIWKHGGSDAQLTKAIEEGFPQLGMVPYKGTLSDEQIRSLVVFMREKEAEMKSKGMTFPKPKAGEVTKTDHLNYTLEVVTEGLKMPWAIAFLPDGSRLVTERGGDLRMISKEGSLDSQKIAGLPAVSAFGQGGLMEVALHPEYSKNGWVYLGFSDPHPEDLEKKEERVLTAVVRGRINDHQWVDNEVIWKGPQKDYSRSGAHFGTRFVFKDGYLFFPVGERGENMNAQKLSNSFGKTFRLHDDGRVPDNNPTFEGKEALAGIWTMGHRNPQGFALHPESGEIWSTEHGPRGGDELNLIQPGNNYGWPVTTYGMNYNGTPITDLTEKEGITNPVTYWVPSIAVCGLDFYSGKPFAKWQNDLLVGSLRAKEIQRLRIRDGKVTEQETILKDYGRIRDVATGPDGLIYALMNDPDQLIRLVPAN